MTEKIGRRVISGKQGTMVYWRMKAGAHATAHQHPQEQFVWVISGSIRFRIGAETRTIEPGDIAVIPGGVEHEAFFPEDTPLLGSRPEPTRSTHRNPQRRFILANRGGHRQSPLH
jgi:quercetin dioxygenase-like cupin family protein